MNRPQSSRISLGAGRASVNARAMRSFSASVMAPPGCPDRHRSRDGSKRGDRWLSLASARAAFVVRSGLFALALPALAAPALRATWRARSCCSRRICPYLVPHGALLVAAHLLLLVARRAVALVRALLIAHGALLAAARISLFLVANPALLRAPHLLFLVARSRDRGRSRAADRAWRAPARGASAAPGRAPRGPLVRALLIAHGALLRAAHLLLLVPRRAFAAFVRRAAIARRARLGPRRTLFPVARPRVALGPVPLLDRPARSCASVCVPRSPGARPRARCTSARSRRVSSIGAIPVDVARGEARSRPRPVRRRAAARRPARGFARSRAPGPAPPRCRDATHLVRERPRRGYKPSSVTARTEPSSNRRGSTRSASARIPAQLLAAHALRRERCAERHRSASVGAGAPRRVRSGARRDRGSR